MKKSNLLLFSILVSFLVYFLVVLLEYLTDGSVNWYVRGGDTREYLCYGESMLRGDYHCGTDILTRMPGLPGLYAFFRLFAGQESSMLMIVLLQVLMGGISMFLLALIAKKNLGIGMDTRLLIVFFSTLFVYKIFDSILLTESLAVATMIIGSYFIFKEQKHYADYLVAGMCFTWCVFLRPYTILFIVLVVIYIICKNFSSLKAAVIPVIVFLVPFILVESIWANRNYRATGRFILLQDNSRYAGLNSDSRSEVTSYVKLWSWMMTIGEDGIFWNPGSMGSWMFGGEFKPDTFQYKPHMFSDSYAIKEIEHVRLQYQKQKGAHDQNEKDSIELALNAEIEKMIVSYKRDKPFEYHVMAPLRILKKTFIHSGPVMPVPPWPEIKKFPIHLLVKIYSTASYLVILFLGLTGILFWWKKNAEAVLLSSMALIILAALALYLRYTEFRLFIIIFPMLGLFTAKLVDYSIHYVKLKLKKSG